MKVTTTTLYKVDYLSKPPDGYKSYTNWTEYPQEALWTYRQMTEKGVRCRIVRQRKRVTVHTGTIEAEELAALCGIQTRA